MTRLVKSLEDLGIRTDTVSYLLEFSALFLKWNAGINLSAARTSEEVLDHIVDSLHVVPHLRGVTRVLDVGSGGGFPVVVAALCLPEISFVGLEPVHKKHAFLRAAVRQLKLTNFEPRAERLEQHVEHAYDVVMSRATFDLNEWLAIGATHTRSGGVVIGFEAVPHLELIDVERHSYQLGEKPRAIIVRRST